MGKGITSLVNTEAIKRNRYYFSTLIDIVAFWPHINWHSEEKLTYLKAKTKGGNSLFLSLFDYTVEKGQRLRAIIKTISRNATYTSPKMQNRRIAAMSSVVPEDIQQKIGNSWHTVKVNRTKDPTDVESISIIICLFNKHSLEIAERFLVLSSTDSGAAKSITDVILAELTKAELTSSKILEKVKYMMALL